MLTTVAEFSLDWFKNDPIGRMVAVGVLVVVGLIVLYFVLRALQWARGNIKPLMIAAVCIGVGFWLISSMEISTGMWIAIGFIGFCMFLGFALFMTQKK